MPSLIHSFILFGVIALAIGLGGRYERYFALMLLASNFAFKAASSALEGVPEAVATGGIDLANLLVSTWLFTRHRAPWLMVQAGIQVVALPNNLVFHVWHTPGVKANAVLVALWVINGALAYLSLAVLSWAVLRREFGPPYRLPKNRTPTTAAAA